MFSSPAERKRGSSFLAREMLRLSLGSQYTDSF